MDRFDLDALLRKLESLADPRYNEFNQSLLPHSDASSLGVRVPQLRAIGKEILKDDWRGFLDASRDGSLFEMRMLHAIVLGGAPCSVEEKIARIDAFLPRVDNWAVCDTLCSSLKPRPRELEPLFAFVCDCADSPIEFRKRFGLVMMMNRYGNDPWAERVMAIYRAFSHEGYYARMGAAWGLATLFLTQREAVLDILRDGVLDDFTHNKAIQKLCESWRVSPEDKQLARALRRPPAGKGPKQTTLCYIERDGQYLMLHRTRKRNDANHDKWIGIGGHIEPGETPMACMLREAQEETGLTLLDCRRRGIVHFRSDEYPDEDMHLFSATRFEGELAPCDEGDLEWIDKSRLLSLTLWEGDRIFLKLLDSGEPFFRLTLRYAGEALVAAELNGEAIPAQTR